MKARAMEINPLVIIACRIEHYRSECAFLGSAVAQRIREGSMPPDDAYWWARIVAGLAHKVLPKDPPCA